MRTSVYYQGVLVDRGFTQMTYVGVPGQTYTVCVENYGSYSFSHWNSGVTTACESVVLTQNLQLTATYNSS